MAVIAALVLTIAASQFFLPAGSDALVGLPYLLLPCTWLALRFTPRNSCTLFAAVILVAVANLAAVSDSLALAGMALAPIPGLAIFGGMLNVILVGALMVERDAALRRAALDELTGLPNRRAFERRAEQIMHAPAAMASRWRWRRSTSTASRPSTTAMAMPPATRR